MLLVCICTIFTATGSTYAMRAPFEAGLHVKETYLTFHEKLINRPKTDAIVIHHVGEPASDVDANYIHRFHIKRGWAGIGYQYVIRKNGSIERGRPFDKVGAQSYGNNYHSLGICLTGNLEVDQPTPMQLKSLTKLTTALCRYYKLTPGPTTIVGHRDYNATDCPGKNMYVLLPMLRTDVQQALDKGKKKTVTVTRRNHGRNFSSSRLAGNSISSD